MAAKKKIKIQARDKERAFKTGPGTREPVYRITKRNSPWSPGANTRNYPDVARGQTKLMLCPGKK